MYIATQRPTCLLLERQVVWRALSRAWAKTGKRIAARMAIMAITTSSSIKVKPVGCFLRIDPPLGARPAATRSVGPLRLAAAWAAVVGGLPLDDSALHIVE